MKPAVPRRRPSPPASPTSPGPRPRRPAVLSAAVQASVQAAVAAAALLWAAQPAGAQGAVPVTLRHDLFSRPRPEAAPATGTPLPAAGGAALAADAPVQAPTPPWRPPLRALVVAGARSMVLIGATVVELGGSLDGYRLQSVDEDGALFIKGRQRVTLLMGRNREGE